MKNSFFDVLFNRYYMMRAKVKHGSEFRLLGRNRIYTQNKGEIVFGDNCTLVSSPQINPVGGGTPMVICAKNGGKIQIGNNVGISNSEIICLKEIILEDNVLIGGGCAIMDSDHHPKNYYNRINNDRESIISAPVIIKEGAFVGAYSVILKGVTVGLHSIIGAGSVVAKSVPDYEIWAGNPAKKIGVVDITK